MGFKKICHHNAAVFKTSTVAPLKMQTVEMHEKRKTNVKPGFKILQYYILAVLPIKPDVNHEKTTVLSSCLESNACILKLFSFTNEKIYLKSRHKISPVPRCARMS